MACITDSYPSVSCTRNTGAIGRFLALIDPDTEERLLTNSLGCAPAFINDSTGCRCLLGVAADISYRRDGVQVSHREVFHLSVGAGIWFDELCRRFGDARVANAVRTRILRNQARRALAAVTPAAVAVG